VKILSPVMDHSESQGSVFLDIKFRDADMQALLDLRVDCAASKDIKFRTFLSDD